MIDPSLLARARAALRDLVHLASERTRTETAVADEYDATTAAARKALEEARAQITARYETERAAAEEAFTRARQSIPVECQREYDATEREYFTVRQQISSDYASSRDRVREEFQEARWTIRTVYEAGKKEAKARLRELQQAQRRVASGHRKLDTVHTRALEHLDECRQSAVHEQIPLPAATEPGSDDPFDDLKEAIAQARELLEALQGLPLPRWFKGVRLVWLFVLLGVVLIYPAGWMTDWSILGVSLLVAVASGVIGGGLTAGLYWLARQQLQETYAQQCQALAEGHAAVQRCEQWLAASYKRLLAQRKAIRDRRNHDLGQAQEKAQQHFARVNRKRTREVRRIEKTYPPRLAEIRARRDAVLREAETVYYETITAAEQRYENDLRQAEETCARQTADSREHHDSDWQALAERWQKGVAEVLATVADVHRESAACFPGWVVAAQQEWTLPSTVPPGLRFGELTIATSDVPHALSGDERLRAGLPERFSLPALLPFPHRASMLYRCPDAASRAAAVQALRAVMLRFLTSVPAGKVRFTILDPVGLGDNFAAFMHLADYDEALVASRIWTEPQHIEQRLIDLTAHMENVIQKYLRNQFESLEEYNAQAGEVAEPFRILVVANFPANFSIDAARRLVSITASGARCGVYTLVSVDTTQPLPQGFTLKELEAPCSVLAWKEGRFVWKDPDFEKYPLVLDAPPDDATATRLLQVVGEAARGVKRVEVPFEIVAPLPQDYWTKDSCNGIDVPLGRCGATRLQHLRLGRGTAQHVLIAGKTGSGKSTLLHALITNLALLYPPDEVEVYLVDFKKGVEFKTYAAEGLPHARVVAIESEREFGLSVLQRLDAELKARGDLFRDAGVQDLAGYRQLDGRRCPRILLIVDEFQEFFVEDDKIAQEAALLLDRLVRQGRAFGIHIHLGSQTLSGAYTLARSTIDQMAVRIALQCSEADAYLILSKDNAAARLLSRPGEAIYNDANGLVEGNDIFQVVWLSDEKRESYLRRIAELARQRHYLPPRPAIVFEGNLPADVEKNALLRQLLEAPAWPESVRSCSAWLGEAIAIKDPTAAVLQPQSGSNLLVVGQQDESALGILVTALISLAAQQAPAAGLEGERGACFHVLDGTPVESPHTGLWKRVAAVLPHPVRVAGWREAAGLLDEAAAEVDRRLKAPHASHAALYLIVFGLQRFRDLRRAEDDFGFSRRGEQRPSPPQQLVTILREGPGLGVHVLLWCDSLNNLNRCFDRPALREFELRVLFQMSAADSSTLIDNPLASKLGVHRALYHSEDRAQPEKFRPYAPPPELWLAWVREQLHARLAGSALAPTGTTSP
jgi:ABC-type multidrug transport system fused ATPase/permease subunit